MKILFMGTSAFSILSLEKLACSRYQLVGVTTQPDRPVGRGYKLTPTPVKQLAQQLNLKIWQPESLKNKEEIDLVTSLKLDLIVVVAFGQILPAEVLAAPELGVINLHPSLLPRYRGAAPIPWAIIKGEEKTGLSIMWLSEGLDSGDIILQKEIKINSEDTAGTLSEKLSFRGAELLIEAVDMIEKGIAPRFSQDNSLATYAPRLQREDGLINWNDPAVKIHNLIRGLNPEIGAYTYVDAQRLKIWRTQLLEKEGEPGKVLEMIKHQGMVVGTGKGSLLITEVQPENKKKMTAAEYLVGHKICRGTNFCASTYVPQIILG